MPMKGSSSTSAVPFVYDVAPRQEAHGMSESHRTLNTVDKLMLKVSMLLLQQGATTAAAPDRDRCGELDKPVLWPKGCWLGEARCQMLTF